MSIEETGSADRDPAAGSRCGTCRHDQSRCTRLRVWTSAGLRWIGLLAIFVVATNALGIETSATEAFCRADAPEAALSLAPS